MSRRRVFVWRHGRTEWNAQQRFQGQADPPLDDTGRGQARSAGALLATFSPELIVSSDLIRAADTAAVLGRLIDMPVQLDAGLRERSLGHWEGLTREEVQTKYPEEFEQWLVGADVERRGGETRDEVAKRALATFRALPEVETTILVTHSATAMALTNALLGLSQQVHVLGPLANAHWSELADEPGHWRVRAHNAGPAGPVIPLLAMDASADSPDAEALDAAPR